MYLDGLFDSTVLKLRENGKKEAHILRGIISHSKRMIVLVSFISFLASWHAFRWPVIVINSMKMKTLPAGLASFQGLYTTDWTLMMAGVCINALPVIALFLLLRKYLLKGIYITSFSDRLWSSEIVGIEQSLDKFGGVKTLHVLEIFSCTH